jgi:hypothetical protein
MPTGVHAAVNLARMATGETSTAGIWVVMFAEKDAARLITMAPTIGAVVTLLVAAALWWIHARRSRPA